MNILLFSILLLLIILLIKYFARSKRNIGLKILTVFGVVIGILALGLNSLFDNSFGASTPVTVRTENQTDKNLKIYIIVFWDNSWNGKGNFVNYYTKLIPKESSEFDFENDGTTEFWVVAKNENNGIEYLNAITESKSQFDFKIIENPNIDSSKVQIAKELTLKTDKKEQMERFSVWANIVLIGFLIMSLIKNTAYKKEQS
jgi:hypothetical protein